ncbi:MAG: type IV toxin-antitoxin system AbiEi family antitoxin domain-containing protein [Acidimicrobiales bacterium]
MDSPLATLAEQQHGLVTIAQARAAGLSRSAILHRLDCGRWQQAGAGVYRLAGTARSWEQRLTALVLASGPVAAASHRSAAALLSIPGFERAGAVEVVTPRPRRHRDPDCLVHRWRVLPEHHLTEVDGIVTTRAARTLVDLAGVLHPLRTERALDNCLAARTVTVGTVRATFIDLARPGRKGVAVMRRLLDERGAGYVPPASELEACFLAVVRRHDLPEPLRQFDVGDVAGWIGRVDFAYPVRKLLIELDSHRHHSSKLDREADTARDRRLRAIGWRVERFGWADVIDPRPVVALLRSLVSGAGDGSTRSDLSKCHQLAG